MWGERWERFGQGKGHEVVFGVRDPHEAKLEELLKSAGEKARQQSRSGRIRQSGRPGYSLARYA
jgi:hypothetical protein